MTVAVNFGTIATAFAALSVSGVTIKDITAIPDSAQMLCPILIPETTYISNYAYTRETFGSMGAAKMNSTYTLTYVYLHCEAGAGISQFDAYSGLIAKIELILEAVAANDVLSGAIDITPETVFDIGVLEDPSANKYWGAHLSFKVLEYTQ